MFRVALLAATVAVAFGGRSPNADLVESLMKTPVGSRFSDNTSEDAILDVPSLIQKYGYPGEVHKVTTSDGYILEMHRIPYGRDRNNKPGPRPVVFLMHGLLSSSADFLILGPGNALGYLLAEEGYDVWLGNARGNFYSRHHLTLNPDSRFDTNFWKFSWEEIGLYDIPAFVDYILEKTGETKMHYVGHSQGGTVFLVLNSLKPEYNEKFISFQGLSPASYFNFNDHSLYNYLAQHEKAIEAAAFAAGYAEFLTNSQFLAVIGQYYCDGKDVFHPECIEVLFSGDAQENFNMTMVPVFLGHTPAGASIRQVAHYGQTIRRGKFARFYHNTLTNLLIYGSVYPPEFDMSKVTVPAYLYYGLADEQVDYRDLLTLSEKLGNTVLTFKADRQNFNHFDFVWGNKVKTEVFDYLFDQLRSAEKNAS